MAKKSTSANSTDTELEEDVEKWIWEVDDPYFAGGAGDIAKLFQAEDFDKPGVLVENAPSNEAALFAREAIQNSWDAAREWKNICKKNSAKIPDFSIHFKFEEVTPSARLSKIFLLGLNEHANHLDAEQARNKKRTDLGLANSVLLTNILTNKHPLRLLTLTEHAGLGMPGNFDNSDSRMVKALLRVGQANIVEGAGGAFGFGKAGLIAASATRVVFAYSAFEPVASEPDVSRRLIGVTYWKSHQRGTHKLNGWARFGSEVSQFRRLENQIKETIIRLARPFVNEDADKVAQELGLDVRDVKNPTQTGTTFLLVDPTITADDLKIAVERYWWPAMIDRNSGLKVEITDYDGSDKSPDVPTNDPNLKPFIEAFNIASQATDPTNPNHDRIDLGKYKPQQDPKEYSLGVVGLVAEPESWSFPDARDGIDHTTMIALVRGPRMIVNYHTFRGLGIPHVRGLFVANASIDDLLRQTEDHAHTKWDPGIKAFNPSAPIIAREVMKKLRENIVDFKQRFAPPPPKPGDINLPILDELSKLMRGKKRIPPDPEPRQVLVRLVEPAHRTATSDDKLVCNATVEFQVADWVWDMIKETKVDVTVSLPIAYVEDDGVGEYLDTKVTCPNQNFKPKGASSGKQSFVGSLARGETAQFKVKSDKYSPDWTVRFSPTAVIDRPKVPNPKKKR